MKALHILRKIIFTILIIFAVPLISLLFANDLGLTLLQMFKFSLLVEMIIFIFMPWWSIGLFALIIMML